jgi:hypothetical protein
VGENTIVARFPHTAVLCLRNTNNTPEQLHIVIEVPGDAVEYDVPVTKISVYTMDEIFEKKLYLLIPFYIFTYESRFQEYDTNEEKLESLKREYQTVIDRLDELTEKGELSSFDKRTIIELADDVMKELTRKYSNIQKEVGDLMSGAMIQTEARRLRDEGIEQGLEQGLERGMEQGLEQGKTEGKAQMLIKMGREYGLNDVTLLERLKEELSVSSEKAAEYLVKYGESLG